MALDLNKIKARLDAVKNKNKAGGFWKPQDGTQTIRIVPTADGDPFKDYFFHYNLHQTLLQFHKDHLTDVLTNTKLLFHFLFLSL